MIQCHDIKAADSFKAITKKIEEIDKATSKFGNVGKQTKSEKETPQPLIQKTRNGSHPG